MPSPLWILPALIAWRVIVGMVLRLTYDRWDARRNSDVTDG
jgi:hypothetical protein